MDFSSRDKHKRLKLWLPLTFAKNAKEPQRQEIIL